MSEVLKRTLVEIFNKKFPPKKEEHIRVLDRVNEILINEDREIRPYDKFGLPGGLLDLKKNIPTIIIPDLHARINFFLNIMFYDGINGITVLDNLRENSLQIVCVGDGFHAESRAADRWKFAFDEFRTEYRKHKHMDEEMRESLGVMEMVMEIKSSYPYNFHFLKGNHENITNEKGGGNFPFRKFAYEGPMVLSYIQKFYGDDFLMKYYSFEKNLPVFAIGRNFLISHSEPEKFFSREEIIQYRDYPDLIKGLTWTDNESSQRGSVKKMLEYYLGEENAVSGYYFGGHRPVSNLYNARANGRYIQIHNPNKFIIVNIKSYSEINLNNDIIELNDNTDEIVKKMKNS